MTKEQIKAEVTKTTIDKAIKAMLDLNTAKREAYEAGKSLKGKKFKELWDIMYDYCNQIAIEAQDGLNKHKYYDVISICVDMSETPYETAYKIFAALGIEVRK